MTTLLSPVTASTETTVAHRSAWRRIVGVVGTLTTVVIVMIACVAVVVAVATHLTPKGQYRVFGHPVMTMSSGSMTPVIRTGDLVIDRAATPAQARRLRVGEIISVREAPGSNVIVTHRITAIVVSGGAVSYITKGDANNAPDSAPRPSTDVVGVFSFAVPRGGYVLDALHRPLVLALLVGSLLLGSLAGPLFRWARRMDDGPIDHPDAIRGGTP